MLTSMYLLGMGTSIFISGGEPPATHGLVWSRSAAGGIEDGGRNRRRCDSAGYQAQFLRLDDEAARGVPIGWAYRLSMELLGAAPESLLGVMRQIVFDRSSATISAPRGSTDTPTGRPRVLPSLSMNPVTKSTGRPAGRLPEGHKINR